MGFYLQFLRVPSTKITDLAIDHLCDHARCLRELDTLHCYVTKAAIEKLKLYCHALSKWNEEMLYCDVNGVQY